MTNQPLDRITHWLASNKLSAFRNQIDDDVFYESLSGTRYQIMTGGIETNNDDARPTDLVVPPRSVFVMGDNRTRSKDSRHFGSIHAGDMIGYVDYLYWPAESWSRFGVYRD